MASKKTSLSELMGSHGANLASSGGLQLSRIHEILGDATPELPRNAVGRHRLVTALHQRFGEGFRNLPGIKNLISQFDDGIALEQKARKLSAIKYTPTPKRGK